MSYKEQIQRVENQYRESGGKWPASPTDVAEWGVARGLLQMHRGAIVRHYADQIAQVWRDEYMTDPQGRRVRVKHAARYPEDGWLWDNMPTAPHIDSYNENFSKGKTIQMVFDFRNDLEELELAAKHQIAA
jgi:hypothetical protein